MKAAGRVLARVALLCLVLLYGASHAAAQTAPIQAPVDESQLPDNQKSATEVNKELSNPISSIWALQIQENTYFIHPGIEDKSSRNSVNVQFQPVLPLALTDDWNLITRPVFQVVNSVPVPTPTGPISEATGVRIPVAGTVTSTGQSIYQATGFGDTILATLLSPSPKLAGPWLLGAGPTFIFPTATTTNVGQKKWQLGPGGVFGYLGEHFIVGLFPQQWFSVGGNGSKQTSQMNLQYFASYFLPHGWSVGTSPNMLVNWYASEGNKVTFPIGLNVSKVQRIGILPVKFQVQGQYMPVNPSVFGQRWNIQVAITPVIPKLIKGNILEGW
jgi:hypothetical protein